MTTEINIVRDADGIVNIGAASQEERVAMFDQIAANNTGITRASIDDQVDMQGIIARDAATAIKPDLNELLLRKVIAISGNGSFNIGVIPIIADPIASIVRERAAELATKHAVKIRFDTRVCATNTDGRGYIAAAGDELVVVGVIVNPICAQPRFFAGHRSGPPPIVIDRPTIGSRIVTGRYSYKDAAIACDDYFVTPNYAVNIDGALHNEPFTIMFATMTDDQMTVSLSALFDYMIRVFTHAGSASAAQFVFAQIEIALSADGLDNVMPNLREALYNNASQPLLPLPPLSGLSKPKQPILDILDTINHGRFSTVFDLAVDADVDTRGFAGIYSRSQIKGKDDKKVRDLISLHTVRAARAAFHAAARLVAADERNKLGTYMIIIGDKLGPARLSAVEKQLLAKPALTLAAKNVLTILNPSERGPVEIEFNRRAAYLDAVINNKCAHIKLYKAFRRAKNNEQISEALGAIKRFFNTDSRDENKMITCTVCKFDIMCPHVRELTQLELAGKSYADIKARLTKYINRAARSDQYYCKICGESVASLDTFGDDNANDHDIVSAMNDELKSFMWSEIAPLVNLIKFPNLVNTSQLITTARNVCYPFIVEIEKQILKSTTNSLDEIKAKKRLYVAIYAFAYFISLMGSSANRTLITFKGFVPKTANLVADMVRYALELISSSRNVVIRDIPGMTADIIKNTLIDAYKKVQAVDIVTEVGTPSMENLLSILMIDPVYRYYYRIDVLDGAIRGKKPPAATNRIDAIDRVDRVMGATIATLEAGGDIYSRARVPNFAGWSLDKFDNLSADAPTVASCAAAYNGYVARSFEAFATRQKQRIYAESMYVDVSATGKGDPSAPMDVVFRDIHEGQSVAAARLAVKEDIILRCTAIACAQNYTVITGPRTRQWSDPVVSLSRLFDENGIEHDWAIYIQRSGKEVSRADIIAAVARGERDDTPIIDRKCVVCSILRSAVGTLSDDKIAAALRARHVVSNFFLFYENRCPRGGLHTFSGTCTKCGIRPEYAIQSEAITYYNEYAESYQRDRENMVIGRSIGSSATTTDKKPPVDYASEYAQWSFNFNAVLDVASKLKINHRLLSALGATEKQDYVSIQSGAHIPADGDDRNGTRVFVINSHIKNMITEYNQLRFFGRLVHPPIGLVLLIDSSGIGRHQVGELATKLPDVFDDHNNRFAYFQRYKKPREIAAFLIQVFCEMVLRIWNDTDKETEKLRRDFVAYIVAKTLRGEELVTKPGAFNWSLLYGDRFSKEKPAYDMNLSKGSNSLTDRDYDDIEQEDGAGDTNAPMSNGFDMENDGDGDDDGNDVRVGADLGLT